jgi:hypothetical protein
MKAVLAHKDVLVFFCVGCHCKHNVSIPRWTWNGDTEKPTITPSLVWNCDPGNPRRCHVVVENGVLKYCNDCWHDLHDEQVPMVDVPEEDTCE